MAVEKVYHGVVVPVVTPLNNNQGVDVSGVRTLLRHMIQRKVDGVFLFGTSAEVTRLTSFDKQQILVASMEECFGKVKTYMGILESGLKSALEDVEIAKAAGIDCLVVCPPYYYGVSDKEILDYFSAIVKHAAMPVMLYNIPQTTGNSIANFVYDELVNWDNVVGVKDSCGKLDQLKEIVSTYGSEAFSVLAGSEDIAYKAMQSGADGLVPSLGNAFPKLFADFYQAAVAREVEKAQFLDDLIQEFNAIKPRDCSFLTPVATRKYALSILDICPPYMSAPFMELDQASKSKIEEYIKKYHSYLV